MGPDRRRLRERGMVLPALLVLAALGAAGWLLSQQTSAATRQLRQDMQTAQALAVAREALIGFAATYRNREHPTADFGYLPCPDLDGDGSSETCGAKDQASVGRLPYLTLNLPDLRDGAGECLWYAVGGGIKNNPKPDILNWDSSGRFRLHDATGTVVPLPGGPAGLAAAVVIAAGPALPGQERSAGPARCGGDPEARHIRHYVEALGATGGSGVIDVRPEPGGNDRIATITTGDIYRQLKRRSSYGPYLQGLLQAIAACLGRSPLPAVVAPEPLGPVVLGRLPPLEQLGGPCRNADLRDATANWAETMRYARCRDGSDCLVGTAGRCRGALIFGGESAGGSQPRLTPADRQVTPHYLEAPTLAALSAGRLAGLAERIELPFGSADAAASTDVALCIP